MQKQWLGGIPYGPQVKKLKEAFPIPEEDFIISHQDIHALIGEPIGSHRYYGVVNSWRKHLLNDLGIDTEWVQGDGLKALNPADRLRVGENDFRRGLRKTGRAFRRTSMIPRDRLDDIGKARYDHQINIMAKLSASAIDAKKDLAIDLSPIRHLPKPNIG